MRLNPLHLPVSKLKQLYMPSISLASVKQSASRPVANFLGPKSSLNDDCVVDVCFPAENLRIFPIE